MLTGHCKGRACAECIYIYIAYACVVYVRMCVCVCVYVCVHVHIQHTADEKNFTNAVLSNIMLCYIIWQTTRLMLTCVIQGMLLCACVSINSHIRCNQPDQV